jgi:hypothetical protein
MTWQYKRRKPRMLRNLKIAEVSSVDSGAGHGVRVMLMKRDAEQRADQALDLVLDSIRKADVGEGEKLSVRPETS